MASGETQSANFIASLITDLVHEAIDKEFNIVEPSTNAGPCQKLFDILGFMPCPMTMDNELEKLNVKTTVPDMQTSRTFSCSSIKELKHKWHSWLTQTMANGNFGNRYRNWNRNRIGSNLFCNNLNVSTLFADSSDDELVIYKRKNPFDTTLFSDISVQTEQPRFRKRFPIVKTAGDRLLNSPVVPCEMTRQTILIDAMPDETPSIQSRQPLTDRFCYMLTDFASALYCSLAIMCCCSPSMFR